MASRQNATDKSKKSWLDSKWVPMTKLSDHEYEHYLEERLLKIDVELALIDENLAALRAQKEGQITAAERATRPIPPLKNQA